MVACAGGVLLGNDGVELLEWGAFVPVLGFGTPAGRHHGVRLSLNTVRTVGANGGRRRSRGQTIRTKRMLGPLT